METPFVLELRATRRSDARLVADEVARHLAARGVGVRLDGQARYAGDPRVDITTLERGEGGNMLAVAVRAPDGQPLWLSPLDLPESSAEAAAATLSFLERWGFVSMMPQEAAMPNVEPSAA